MKNLNNISLTSTKKEKLQITEQFSKCPEIKAMLTKKHKAHTIQNYRNLVLKMTVPSTPYLGRL